MNGVFITGSNTDVGKTTVGVEIIRHLSKTRKVRARKPVETNCQLIDEAYAPKDAIALNEACLEPESLSMQDLLHSFNLNSFRWSDCIINPQIHNL